MNRENLLKVSVLIALLVFVFAVFYLIDTNTSFLNIFIPPQEISENNANLRITPGISVSELELSSLLQQEITIPEEFRTGIFETSRQLNLPKNFKISVFAAGMKKQRFFDFDQENNLIVADMAAMQVLLLKDQNQDGVAEQSIIIDQGLNNPSSIDFYNGDLYMGETDKVVVYKNLTTSGTFTEKKVLVTGLPTGGHITRTVRVGPDEKLYVSIGSSCNVCEEADQRRGAVMQYNLDGTNGVIYAKGLRNSVGILFAKGPFPEEQFWSVDMGRDLIGDDLPPEEVNIIEKDQHYGWPYCYGLAVANPEYPDKTNFCQEQTELPLFQMQAHSAPLGLIFPNQQSTFPDELDSNLFIAFHGSWNRSIPTGYKIVRLKVDNPHTAPINFITGWLDESGKVWGRPAGINFDQNGVLYISDDQAGVIYRVTYQP